METKKFSKVNDYLLPWAVVPRVFVDDGPVPALVYAETHTKYLVKYVKLSKVEDVEEPSFTSLKDMSPGQIRKTICVDLEALLLTRHLV